MSDDDGAVAVAVDVTLREFGDIPQTFVTVPLGGHNCVILIGMARLEDGTVKLRMDATGFKAMPELIEMLTQLVEHLDTTAYSITDEDGVTFVEAHRKDED